MSGPTVAAALAQGLVDLGVRLAFGVSGGGIAAVWSEVGGRADLRLIHTQHESGAAFAATEASLATGRPVAVLVTTGPGLTNALTGLVAARQEGARVILVSGHTPAARRGCGATQETSGAGPALDLGAAGSVVHLADALESPAQLGVALRRLALRLARPGGCVAHLAVPGDVALRALPAAPRIARVRHAAPEPDAATLDEVAGALEAGRAVILVGRDARGADVRGIVDRRRARVICTPDAKGILSDDHPCHRGVVGVAGHDEALAALAEPFDLLLALGARLGEAETGWDGALRPRERIVSVVGGDDGDVGAYADVAQTLVEAEPRLWVERLIDRLGPARAAAPASRPPPLALLPGLARPAAVMAAVQEVVVDGSDAVVLAESGASFAWAIHLLRMPAPRLRVSVGWGAMGHATTGAVGVAATGRRAVAIVGDGALLMGNELLTAARHRLPVVWIVLDDQGYGMCRHGMRAQGFRGIDLDQPRVDLAALARGVGLLGLEVAREADLADALQEAMAADGPALVAVRVDPDIPPPMGRRVQALTFHAEEPA